MTSVHIDVAEKTQSAPRPDSETPFRLLIAGDFSGGASRLRKPIQIDRDNFEKVMGLLSPTLKLTLAGENWPVSFHELDDFHPDRLYERLPFEDLRARAVERPAAPPAVTPPPNISGADLISDLLGEGAAPARARPRGEWEQMLHDITAPYTEPKPDPAQQAAAVETDLARSAAMRAIMHHAAFQALESAWRGLWFLVRRLETGADLKVYVLDLPYDELVSAPGLDILKRVAVEEAVSTPGADPWAVIAGLYYFEPKQESALAQVAAIARAANAPFLSGVAPQVVGLEPAFEDLRRSQDAPWVGLALPRFLLRLPYGADTSPIESFDFEEMPAAPQHERYLWGSPAVACGCLMGEGFRRFGWRMWPGSVSEIDGLPAHFYQSGGENCIKPCAEVLLTEEAAGLLLDRGLMPLISIKGTDRVRLGRFQSIASPAAPLEGRWR